MNDGELWSFLRAVLSQGGGIWLDAGDICPPHPRGGPQR